jgi:diguanylate cyclase (GGDEF)-like protein
MLRRRPSLLAWCGLASLALIVALGIVLGTSLSGILHAHTVRASVDQAAFVASHGLPAAVPERDVEDGLTRREIALIDTALRSGGVAPQVAGLEIRNAAGRLVYSSTRDRRPLRASDSGVDRAFGGEPVSEEATVGGMPVLAVSVPLRYFGRLGASGTVTVYLPKAVMDARTAPDTRRLYLILGVGLALLFGLLLPILAAFSRKLRRQAADNERLALHDSLTGLSNRALFNARLEAACADGRGATGACLLSLDVDRFKDVNDTLGHPAGDNLLRELGRRLRVAVREGDTVARIGGDEFAVILPRVEEVDVLPIAHRILRSLALPFDVGPATVEVSISVGAALAPQHGADPEALLRRADHAMYEAKVGGGGYRIASDEPMSLTVASSTAAPVTAAL